MIPRHGLLAAWADTRWAMRLSKTALARRRARLWAEMAPILAKTPALSGYAGRSLQNVPIVDAAAIRTAFAQWNSAGIDYQAAMAAAEEAERGGAGIVRDGIAVGLSTGTSDVRGMFLASAVERARYIGQSIARLLPVSAPVVGARIALVLRAESALYRDVANGRFAFLHLAIDLDPHAMSEALERFRPTILIAPPRELSMIAGVAPRLPTLARIFWGAEPMGVLERAWIADRLGCRPDPIYQATEGFIAAACQFGTLHLNDDSLEIELEPVPLVDAYRPIVTDLRRHVQPIVRVRLDDIVRLDQRACRCGFAGRVIAPVGGRVQDIWTTGTGLHLPEAIDRRFEEAVGPAARWQVQGGPSMVTIKALAPRDGERLRTAARSLNADAHIDVRIMRDLPCAPKRRRVTWRPDA